MKIPRILSLCLFFSVLACESKTETAATTAPATAQSNKDDSVDSTEKEDDDSSNPNTNPDNDSTETPVIRDINEETALGIMEASCLAAGCHNSTDQIIDSETLVQHLEDETMPPPDQSRYTLSDTRRAELLLYLEGRDD